MKIAKMLFAVLASASTLAGLTIHSNPTPQIEAPILKATIEPKDIIIYAKYDIPILENISLVSNTVGTMDIGEKIYAKDFYNDEYYSIDEGYIRIKDVIKDRDYVFYPVEIIKYSKSNAEIVDKPNTEGLVIEIYPLNTEIHIVGYNDNNYYKTIDGLYVHEDWLMDYVYAEPAQPISIPETANTYIPSGSGYETITAWGGVYYYGERKETYYSSRVLYHYRTPEWYLDAEGFYHDANGYYVVAASDMAQGTIFDCSKGSCIVLDSGCAAGTTDYYVNW